MFSSKSFRNLAPALLHTLGVDRSEFDEWPAEELAMRLRDDGVDVPPDANPHDLVAFAEAFYADRVERPKRYSIHNPEFIDAHGVAYVPRPKNRNHRNPPHHKKQQQAGEQSMQIQPVDFEEKHEEPLIPSPRHANQRDNLDNERQILSDPPMFASEMTDTEKTRLKDQHLSADALGAVEVVEEDDPRVHGESPETAAIREHFRFIEDEEATEARIKNEFQRPSLSVARMFANMNHARKTNGEPYSVFWTNTGRFCFSRGRGCCRLIDPFGEGSTSELAKYGVGISLYFKTLKWLFWVFFLMFLVTLPEMIINAQGGSRPKSLFTMDSTSLGHLTDQTFFVNETTFQSGNTTGVNATILRKFDNSPVLIPFTTCENGTLCAVDRATLGLWYMAMDLVAVGIFVLGLRWLHYFTKLEGSRITKHHITVEEYTIQVVSVPPESTELSLKKFFAELTGEPVHDVFLVQDNGELLNLYVKRGKLVNKLWKQAATVHLLKEDRRSKPGVHAIRDDKVLLKKLDRAIRQYDKTYAVFLDLNEQRAKMNPGTKALSAFVTFETQQGFLKAMDLFPPGFFNLRNQPPELRLGKKPLKVRQAPPPTTILWENTHYKWRSRRWRRWSTMFGTFVSLAVTVVVCFFTERERNALKSAIFSEECSLIEDIQSGLFANSTTMANMTDLASILQAIDDEDASATALAEIDSALRACFCSSLNYGEAAAALLTPGSLCSPYYVQKSPLYALTFLATVVISGVNILVQSVIARMSTFEKHHSVVNMELSIARRVFVVLLINTGLILLAVNAAFPGANWIGSGHYADFTPDWYASVGTSLAITMTINVLSPHIFPFMGYWYFMARRRSHLAYSQRELNEMYLGPVFFLSYRSAQLLMTVFVTLLYSAGMPSLYPIACAMFLVHFYVDKFLLFNYYRTPPSYSEKLSEWFVGTLSYAIIGHLGFATWMFSAPGIFWDGISTADTSTLATYLGLNTTIDDGSFDFSRRLSQTHVLPLYISLLIMAILKVLSFSFTWIDRIRTLFCITVTCGIFDDGTIKRRYLNPDYSDAVEQGELRGLINYNMLENPTYARALGIDAKFAKEHRHVASVHEASAVELPVLPRSFKIAPLEEAEAKHRSVESRARAESVESSKTMPQEREGTSGGRPLSINNRKSVADQYGLNGEDVEQGRGRAGSRTSARLANAFRVDNNDVAAAAASPGETRRDSRRTSRPRGESTSNQEYRNSLARAFDVSRDEFS